MLSNVDRWLAARVRWDGEPDGGKPPAADPPKGDEPKQVDFEAFLAGQSDEVKAAYAAHTAGLKTALDKEREENKATKKAEAEKAKAAEEAEKKRLAEQGEYKTLAEQAEARAKAAEEQAAQVEPLSEKLGRYEAALKTQLDALRKDVPAHIGELLDDMDVAAQLEYLTKHAKELHPEEKTPGTPPRNPRRQTPGNNEPNNEPRRPLVRL